MKAPSSPVVRSVAAVWVLLAALWSSDALAQDAGAGLREAYFRAVADHFGLPEAEVNIVGDWDLSPDEVPVVLFISAGAGISPDALVGFRRGGRPWSQVARRFGMGPGSFHIAFASGVRLGVLSRAYEEFQRLPPGDWDGIELQDAEIVALVNIKVLSEQVGVPPLRVLRSGEEAGSFMAGFGRIRQSPSVHGSLPKLPD